MADLLSIITVLVVGVAFPFQVLAAFRKKTLLQINATLFSSWILVENVPAAVRLLPAGVSWGLLIVWVFISCMVWKMATEPAPQA